MSTIKVMVIKCVTALLISTIMASSLVAYAASELQSTVTIHDGDKVTTLDTHCITAEDILSDAGISVGEDDLLKFNLKNGEGSLVIERAFDVYITVGSDTKKITMTKGTVAQAMKKANITLGEHDICNMNANDILTKESYIDIVRVNCFTETYDEVIPYTCKVEYSSTMAKGDKKVINGANGSKTVTLKKTFKNGVLADSQVVSTVVTKKPIDQKTIIGTKVKATATKPVINSVGTIPYTSIKTISSLKAPSSLTLTSKGIPTSYKKKVQVQATAYTDHTKTPLAWCAEGKKYPQTGYIAVNPKVIPYGTKMFIVSADGRYVYGYAIAADTGGFIKKRPNNVDLFFNTESECRTFGRRDVVIYFL